MCFHGDEGWLVEVVYVLWHIQLVALGRNTETWSKGRHLKVLVNVETVEAVSDEDEEDRGGGFQI